MVIALSIVLAVNTISTRYTIKNSETLQNLFQINKNYSKKFHPIKKHNIINEYYSKKYYFDKYTTRQIMFSKIYHEQTLFDSLKRKIKENLITYSNYKTEYDELSKTLTTSYKKEFKISKNRFEKIENKAFKKFMKNLPNNEIIYNVTLKYTSPKGRNTYSKNAEYNTSSIFKMLEEVRMLKEKEASKEFIKKKERNKLTKTLRYKILKRDNFSCEICGRTAEDGAKLHIDHVIPISKGGLTAEENLRVLCEKCNLGKGSQIE